MAEELQQGWVCPMCKTVFAPTKKMCKPCSKQLKEEGGGTTEQLLQEQNNENFGNGTAWEW